MPSKLTPEERLKLIDRVRQGESVVNVCKEAGISRTLFYRLKKRLTQKPPYEILEAVAPQKRKIGRVKGQVLPKIEQEVLREVSLHPQFSVPKLHKSLRQKLGKQTPGRHAIQKILERHELSTHAKRLAFAQEEQEFRTNPSKLSAHERLALVEEVIKKGKKVSEACKKYGISRVLFYRLKKRYEEAEGKLSALEDKKPKIEIYPRQASYEQERHVLDLVLQDPTLSCRTIAQQAKGILGYHGVQNVLRRNGLSTLEQRISWAKTYEVPAPAPRPVFWLGPVLKILRFVVAPFITVPRMAIRSLPYGIFFGAISAALFVLYQVLILFINAPLFDKAGYLFAMTALVFGFIFFLYSLKYFLSLSFVLVSPGRSEKEGQIGSLRSGLITGIENVQLQRYPFVSVHIPLYNEKRVAERILKAATSLEYPNYEVIVVDDSTDETTEIVRRFESSTFPQVRVIHRDSRQGFKGGALQVALENTDPRAEYILVFDADFIPFPDTIEQFLKYFKIAEGNEGQRERMTESGLSLASKTSDSLIPSPAQSTIAAVQGYQWHVLNKSENWITRGVRTEYAGSYVVERSATEIYQGLKMIAGSVYMIRADILRQYGWGTSITEDFELTLRLYQDGYKVVYTPYIQAPSECVSTIRRLIRQRMRWAEGHSFNIKKYFFPLLFGTRRPIQRLENAADNAKIPNQNGLTLREKLEFLYLAPYYLQATFFMVGTISWFLSEAVFKVHFPFWTQTLGWSLVFVNFLSLPLMNLAGLFLEEAEEKDYLGIFSFVLLSYILVPFQGYAAVKGFLEKKEGPWFRTPKTGVITDVIGRARFYRWLKKLNIWPVLKPATANFGTTGRQDFFPSLLPPSLSLSSFRILGGYNVRSRRVPLMARGALAFVLMIAFFINYLTFFTAVPVRAQTNPEIEQEINIYQAQNLQNGASTTSTTYTPADNSLGIVSWDSSKYDTGSQVFFEAVFKSKSPIGADRSIDLLGSKPVISYYDNVGGDLKVVFCNDSQCTGEDETIVTVDSQDDVGRYNKIKVLSTRVTVVYFNNTSNDLKLATCDATTITACDTQAEWTVTCVVGASGCTNTETYANTGYIPDFMNLQYPRIVYFALAPNGSNYDGKLYYLECTNNACTTSSTPLLLDTPFTNQWLIGSISLMYTAIAPIDSVNLPYVAWYYFPTADPKLRYCPASPCDTLANWSAEITISETGDKGRHISLVTNIGGYPRISYYDNTNADLVVRICSDIDCSASTGLTPDTVGSVGTNTSIILQPPSPSADNPIVAYIGNGNLKIFRCNNSDCSTGYTINIPDGQNVSSSTLGNLNRTLIWRGSAPSIVIQDNQQNLALISCNDVYCSNTDELISYPDPVSGSGGTTYTAYVGLFSTSGSQVSCQGANVEVSTSKRYFNRQRTSCNLSGMATGDYTIRIRTDNSSGAIDLLSARLIIQQSGGSGWIDKTETQIEIGARQPSLSNTTYATLTYPKIYYYDTSKYSPNSGAGFAVYFEAALSNGNTTNTVYARLLQCTADNDCSTGTAVVGSEVFCSNTGGTTSSCSSAYARQRSGDIKDNLLTGNRYAVQVRVSAGTTSVIANAKIIIDQTNQGSGVTALETFKMYNNHTPLGNRPGDYARYRYINYFDPAKFSGTKTYYFESTLLAVSATTAFAQLYNLSDTQVISGSEISTTNTTATRVRTATSITMPATAKEVIVRIKCSGCTTSGLNDNNGWLVIQISGLPVPEYVIFALPAILFLPKIVSWWRVRRLARKKLALVIADNG